jgi:hypothetical protein
MSLSLKSSIFFATYLIGGLFLAALTFERFGVLPILGWFVVFGVLQFVLLRCPS